MDHTPTTPPELWQPKSSADLNALKANNLIYRAESGSSTVVRTSPGVIIKYGGTRFAEEVCAMVFARRQTSIPIPRVLYAPSRDPTSPDCVWYICMTEVKGASLDKSIDSMTSHELDHISVQLKQILAQLRSVKPHTLGSVTGGPYRNTYFPEQVAPDRAFVNTREFVEQYRSMLMLFCTQEFTDGLLSGLPLDTDIVFSHGDLLPRNIMVDGSTITAIVDWELAGFYPEYLEYCRMNSPDWTTPNWFYVVQSIFPGPPRQTLIKTFHKLTSVIWQTLL